MRKYGLYIIALTVLVFTGCEEKSPDVNEPTYNIDPDEQFSGGTTTEFIASSQAFSTPAPNLSAVSLEKHLEGDFNFEQNFVKAPAEVNGGLGPLFNNVSCINCHISDGRGRPPLDNRTLESMLLRISVEGQNPDGGPNPVPGFGGQLQTRSIFGYQPEGEVLISHTEIAGTYPDGAPYTLLKPEYTVTGALPAGVLLSPRVAPQVFGLGLLEAIPEQNILVYADENDIDGDGISGRPNYVREAQSGSIMLGRFGWKANTPTLLHQSAAAYVNDMGVTNPLFKMENCYNNAECDTLGDDPEISMEILESVEFYVQTLAVPARRDFYDPDVLAGKELFNKIGCAGCHVPQYTTGYHEIGELADQKIFPYTDLLLHDMGEELADNRPDHLADGYEWKTPPLWGLGLISVVNGHTNLLHDGRARSIEEAILWHGGEGEDSKNEFMNLSASEREELLIFLKSL